MHQVLEILQTGTKPKPTSTSFNLQLTPSDKVSLPAVFYGCLLTAIVMEITPKSPVVSPCRGDCCCLGLCCTPESKHGRLLLFYLCSRKAVPGRFSGERPAQQLWGERVPTSSGGLSPLCPCPALLHHSWTGRWRRNVQFVRGADFAPGRCLLPSRLKSNVCSPATSSNLLHSPGSSLVLHRLMWKSCMFWRGGVRL